MLINETTLLIEETTLMIWIWMLYFVSLQSIENKYSTNNFYIYGQIHQTRNDRPQRKGRGESLLQTSDRTQHRLQ